MASAAFACPKTHFFKICFPYSAVYVKINGIVFIRCCRLRGRFQAGLYPVSANVPLGAQTGATPDGRLAFTPIADGIGPMSGRDVKGPTATANSVAKLEQGVASNGTLLNQKFHPSALAGMEGLTKFVALIRSYFDQKGMHMQFNVVTRETLIDAQQHPEKYKTLVVRVAGYSALFTTLSRSLQDDIINRTQQGF